MGVLKTIFGAALALISANTAVQALPHSPSARVQVFATCAGRLSALEEHQRMFDGPASEVTAKHKATFDDVIAALLPDAHKQGMPRRQALIWQVEAKMSQAVLMQQATFGTDARRVQAAKQAAQARIDECSGLLLGA